jgi:(S)-mandelate dehydrogenase
MAKPTLSSSLTLPEIREKARCRLPRGLSEFISCLRLRPRVLVDVSLRSTQTTPFGRTLSLPLAIAPTGAAGLVHHRGETALARAAHRAGIPSPSPLDR